MKPTTDSLVERLRSTIRDVPDFPKAGIVFKDISPVLADPALFRETTDALAAAFERDRVTHVVAIESRGFILGGPVAQRLGAGLVPVRKPGKLPWKTRRVEYALEYGKDALEMHLDGLPAGARALVVDDVLATGGTAAAAGSLAEQVGGTVVGYAFLMELGFLAGRNRLGANRVTTLIEY